MKRAIGSQGLYIVNTAPWRIYRPEIDKKKCTNCGICLAFCPVGSIERHEGSITINYDYCKGCGICRNECPRKAVDWKEEE